MSPSFDHEKLQVYQIAIAFVAWATETTTDIPRSVSARQHLEAASVSVALNIAEGNGKFALRDRRRYLDISLGSAFECAASLDVLAAQKWLAKDAIVEGKVMLHSVVSMLIGLTRSVDQRLAEAGPVYESGIEEEE
ncbi:MAG: four helix bundle protein [Caldilineales bacterium]|nr:four helix bundle protein [Caldilineales bacterium]